MSATPKDTKLARSRELELLSREMWLAKQLDMPQDWNAGVTTQESRQAAIRAYILENQLADTVIARTRAQGALTPRLVYQRLYGQPLQTDELDFAFTAQERA